MPFKKSHRTRWVLGRLGACVLAMSFLLLPPQQVYADVFQYTDADGGLHFVDSAEKIPEEFRDQLKTQPELKPISKVDPGRKKLYEKEHYTPSVAARQKVELFVTDWCGYCRKLEAFLNENGISYQKFDIEKNASAKRIHASLGSGVPIARVGKTVIEGYNPDAILQAVAKK